MSPATTTGAGTFDPTAAGDAFTRFARALTDAADARAPTVTIAITDAVQLFSLVEQVAFLLRAVKTPEPPAPPSRSTLRLG